MDFLYHHTAYGGARISPSAGGEKDIFYLSIMLLKGKVCANNLTIKASEHGNFFVAFGYSGRFVVVHPCSTLSLHCWVVPTQNVEVENTVKFGIFHPSRVTQ